jgi:hypothetical protein
MQLTLSAEGERTALYEFIKLIVQLKTKQKRMNKKALTLNTKNNTHIYNAHAQKKKRKNVITDNILLKRA